MTGNREDEKVVQWLLQRWQEGDVPPWRKPWAPPPWPTMPHNPFTQKAYHGGNAVLLHLAGVAWDSPLYATYKQIQEQGGQVRKGEHGVPILVRKEWTPKEAQGGSGQALGPQDRVPGVDPTLAQSVEQGGGLGESSRRGFVRSYTVFNLAQTDGLEALLHQAAPEAAWDPHFAGQRFLEHLKELGIQVNQGLGDRAYCQPGEARIVMPAEGRFATPSAYYATLLHESIHSSKLTLQRPDWYRARGMNADQAYAAEELVAELGMLLLARRLNVPITPEDAERTASYLKGWTFRAALEENPKILYQTARLAQAAADHLAGPEFTQQLEVEQQNRASPAHRVVLTHRKDLPTVTEPDTLASGVVRETQIHPRQEIAGRLLDIGQSALILDTPELGRVQVETYRRLSVALAEELGQRVGQEITATLDSTGTRFRVRDGAGWAAEQVFSGPAIPFGLLSSRNMEKPNAQAISGILTQIHEENSVELATNSGPVLVHGKSPAKEHQAEIRQRLGQPVTITPNAEGTLHVEPGVAPAHRVQASPRRRS